VGSIVERNIAIERMIFATLAKSVNVYNSEKPNYGTVYPNVANVGGLQIQGVKGEVVVLYFESLTTQNLKSSGVPEG
jgi:hypothetical protein